MTYDRTLLKSKFFDRERARKLPGATLVLLSLTGKTPAGVNTYSAVSTVEGGWYAEAARGTDGSVYTKLQLADVNGDLRALIDGTGDTDRTTHFAVSGLIYRVEPDQTLRPMTEPKIWELRGYQTADTYDG
jgi:hypothetical protein